MECLPKNPTLRELSSVEREREERMVTERLAKTPVRLAMDLTEEFAEQLPAEFRRRLFKLLDEAMLSDLRESRRNLRRYRIENDVEEGASGG